ncbi:penicillin-binding protein 1C [Rapidithrix thailandica]|uniref:peptidoglycan glycosyltransferase n=1 Tax=Rapidithrix thailandica TaxID=413964 RepID=A0AAW9S9R9_9BACT
MKNKKKLILLRNLLFGILALLLAFICLDMAFPFPVRLSYSQVITSRKGEILQAFLNRGDKWRMKVTLEEVSPELVEAFLKKEDKYFYYHLGINPVAVSRAFANNLLKGKTTSGASTITMQVTRLLEPKSRTYANKLWEMFRSFQLEWHYSKDEIFEMYLNLVPYGGNIEGVKAASLLYFGTTPDKLSMAQVMTLAIIPNRPTTLALGKNNSLIEKERNQWLKRFQQAGFFADTDYESARAEPLDAYRRPAPKIIPHLASRLHRKYPLQPNLATTINSEMQQKVAQIVKNYSRSVRRFDIHNAAVMVIDNANREVLAYVGSPDFYDNQHAGQVDGIQAVRSPGSTLKPLLYATGFDMGLFTPKLTINDVPIDYDGYSPENFDKKFHGKISVETALAKSLNVPAVKALKQIDVPVFIQKLIESGFAQIEKDKYKLGYSVALGGCGVTLEELSTLYCAFSNEGAYAPVRYLQNERDSVSQRQVLSPAATYMTTEILTQLERPDLPNNYQSSSNVPKVAWKTGTSYGRRDAWSIGYNKDFTIGIWVGNFSGNGVRELTGSQIATPLLFKLFHTIDYNSKKEWFGMPEDMQFRLVCSESGRIPDHSCKHQITDYFIPLISHNQQCTHQKLYFTQPDGNYTYCNQCLPPAGYTKKLYPNYPPELIAYFETEKIPYAKVPPHNPSCKRIFPNKPPAIVSPVEGREYILPEKDTQLMLKCNASGDVAYVYWYINNQFYKKSAATEKVFFTPPKGKVKISCSDDKGRNSDIVVQVI